MLSSEITDFLGKKSLSPSQFPHIPFSWLTSTEGVSILKWGLK